MEDLEFAAASLLQLAESTAGIGGSFKSDDQSFARTETAKKSTAASISSACRVSRGKRNYISSLQVRQTFLSNAVQHLRAYRALPRRKALLKTGDAHGGSSKTEATARPDTKVAGYDALGDSELKEDEHTRKKFVPLHPPSAASQQEPLPLRLTKEALEFAATKRACEYQHLPAIALLQFIFNLNSEARFDSTSSGQRACLTTDTCGVGAGSSPPLRQLSPQLEVCFPALRRLAGRASRAAQHQHQHQHQHQRSPSGLPTSSEAECYRGMEAVSSITQDMIDILSFLRGRNDAQEGTIMDTDDALTVTTTATSDSKSQASTVATARRPLMQVVERDTVTILQGDDRVRIVASSTTSSGDDTNSVTTVETDCTESSARGVDTLHEKHEMQLQKHAEGALFSDPRLPASEVYQVQVVCEGGGADEGISTVDMRILVTHDGLDRLRFMEVFCDSRALEAVLASGFIS